VPLVSKQKTKKFKILKRGGKCLGHAVFEQWAVLAGIPVEVGNKIK
jgi:hypothetical protein